MKNDDIFASEKTKHKDMRWRVMLSKRWFLLPDEMRVKYERLNWNHLEIKKSDKNKGQF